MVKKGREVGNKEIDRNRYTKSEQLSDRKTEAERVRERETERKAEQEK